MEGAGARQLIVDQYGAPLAVPAQSYQLWGDPLTRGFQNTFHLRGASAVLNPQPEPAPHYSARKT
jgi:hypothetical protein